MIQALTLLRELVALPSVNPAFVPPNTPGTGEKRVADFLLSTAAKATLDVEFQEVFPNRSNVLARLTPRGRIKHRIVLAPHMDTVGGTPKQFDPVLKGGRLYGRGACDTKGSIAAMLSALCTLAQAPGRPAQTEIVFAGLVDEENHQTGSRALAATGLRADLAIVGEPTGLKVVTAHKGDLWLTIQTRGKSAHGACPELGRNAVHAMARVVEILETTYAAGLRRRRHPLLGHPTISVGSISGGTQPNVVPDRCWISADRRTLPGETEASVKREILAALHQRGLRASVADGKGAPCFPLETDSRLPWVQRLMACVSQRAPVGVHYFCDASVLAHAGIPSVVFGPGDIAQAHTANEWVSRRSLEGATASLLRFLQELP